MSEGFKITTRGQGSELVLLHGWGMHSGIWGELVDVLATEFRVNLVDLPGHGVNRHVPLSCDLNTVAELILSELPPAAWLGWSLGGLVTLAAALRQPCKVQRIILVAANPSFSKQPGWDCGVDQAAQQAFSDGLQTDAAGTFNQFCLRTFGVHWKKELQQRLGAEPKIENAPTSSVLNAGLHLLYNNNLLPDLDACKMPALFLGGLRDRTVRPQSLDQAAALMPDARTSFIPAAGHAPFISHEQTFLNIVSGFLHEGDLT